jgi:hypothetical protein
MHALRSLLIPFAGTTADHPYRVRRQRQSPPRVRTNNCRCLRHQGAALAGLTEQQRGQIGRWRNAAQRRLLISSIYGRAGLPEQIFGVNEPIPGRGSERLRDIGPTMWEREKCVSSEVSPTCRAKRAEFDLCYLGPSRIALDFGATATPSLQPGDELMLVKK